jgi:hypothetical protein
VDGRSGRAKLAARKTKEIAPAEGFIMRAKSCEDLLESLREMEIIDTHEHIMSLQEVKQEPLHLFRVFENSYARLDFTTAGMPPEVWQEEDPEDIWAVWKTFQDRVGLTSFVKNIIRALQDLYGLQGSTITQDNWRELSERVIEAYENQAWYFYVLKQRARFRVSFLDKFWSVEKFDHDPELFAPVLRTNPFILGRGFVSGYPLGKVLHTAVEEVARQWGFGLKTFESYLSLIDTAIQRYRDHGAPAVKIGTAYERSLFFENISRDVAARLYARNPVDLSKDEQRKLQDFMAHHVVRKATEAGLPVQIHTGVLARNANILANSNPENLNNLFLEHPEATFVLLHFSFPYVRQVCCLAKMFPNIFLDFCWVPMLSARAACRALDECLDLVPYNKIMWGGDAYRVEEAYGAGCLAREVTASVLGNRIKKEDMDLEMALRISRAIFQENTLPVYGAHAVRQQGSSLEAFS